jgi:hypothetical protein
MIVHIHQSIYFAEAATDERERREEDVCVLPLCGPTAPPRDRECADVNTVARHD